MANSKRFVSFTILVKIAPAPHITHDFDNILG